MSDSPEKKHPWAKFKAKKSTGHAPLQPPVWRQVTKAAGAATPLPAPIAPVVERAGLGKKAAPGDDRAGAKVSGRAGSSAPVALVAPVGPVTKKVMEDGPRSAVSDELAEALKALAIEYAPLPLGTTPFMSAKEKHAEAAERRRRRRRTSWRFAGAVLGAIGVLHLLVTHFLFQEPSAEALEAEAAKIAQAVVLLQSSSERPLEIAQAVTVQRDRVSPERLRYDAVVTLRLRQPLYGPALTNGTVSYRRLQEALPQAREQHLKFNLFGAGERLQAPELPRLLQVMHRAGEPMVVRVPFNATRFGWRWRISPAQLSDRTVDRQFSGALIERFADAPNLIFGSPATMAEVRVLTKQAQEFVTAVAREVQRRAEVQAVAEPPKPAAEVGAETGLPALGSAEAAAEGAGPLPQIDRKNRRPSPRRRSNRRNQRGPRDCRR